MKVQNLFDILQDTQDLLSYFEDVANRDQMVSRLERLKRQVPDELFDTIESLRMSTSAALEDQLELGGSLMDGDDSEEIPLTGLESLTETDSSTFETPTDIEPGLTNPTTENESKEKISSLARSLLHS